MSSQLVNIIISIVGTAVTALLAWLTGLVTKWINSKVKDKNTAALLASVASIVSDAVKSVYQTYVQSLKDNGTFTDEAKKCAKEQALSLIEARLTPEMSQFIQSTYGDVGKYLSEAIEATLYDFKNK